MKEEIKKRIDALRQRMKSLHLDAFIIPSTDPHMSEYVAQHWKVREWISGFTGSAGTVVITQNCAGLWTDSRYFIQAAEQLDGTGIELFKEMLPETPSISEFLCNKLQTCAVVGIDGRMFSVSQFESLRKELEPAAIQIESNTDIIDEVWKDRPSLPLTPPFIYDLRFAGKSCADKLKEIRSALSAQSADSIFISALDEIAWTLNLRGSDIACNPVFISYLLITADDATLFIDPAKMTTGIADYLQQSGVKHLPYAETAHHLSTLKVKHLLIQPAKTNYTMYSAISPDCGLIFADSPVALLKSIRNATEIEGVHQAMIRDGVAMVRFLKWLEESVASGKESELSITAKLEEFRKEGALFMGDSFDTIAGYGPHAAIVHYSATPESNSTLLPKGFLLLDSGAQYLDGTTDITRTIALGELTDEEKRDYTLVLKGHIALAMACFPAGTRGAQLDVLARMPLWQHKMNYLHGTGHGIGHFMNVHEGPQSIRMNENPVALQPGMVTSNEPGVYKGGSHGIRIENLILTCKDGEGMYGDYYNFETLTLCPICTKAVIADWLTENERAWLNNYHREVFDKIAPQLNEEEQEWLSKATMAI